MSCLKHNGVPSYDGQLLLPLDFEEELYIRDPQTQTEQSYIDKEKQIASFIRSGERLVNFRRSEFDYPDGEVPEDAIPDPMAALGFDLADASALKKKLEEKAASASNKAEEADAPAEGVAGGTAEKSSPPTSE